MGKTLLEIEETNKNNQQYQKRYQYLQQQPNQNLGQFLPVGEQILLRQPPQKIQWSTPKPKRWKFLGRYCYSHRNCDLWGSKCLWKKPGHDTRASWIDKRGRLTARCGDC